MIRINLLPARVSRRKLAARQQDLLMVLALVLAIVGNAVWSEGRAAALGARERKLRTTRESIAKLEQIVGEVDSIKAQQAAIKDKLAVLDKLKAGRQGPVRVLDDLATLVPKKLWLKKFEEKGGAGTLEGTAVTIDDVSELLAALKRSQHFANAELKKTVARSDKKHKLVDFTITATVNYTPAAPAAPAVAAAPPKR
jgi:type IV pilus assembly protein PilN